MRGPCLTRGRFPGWQTLAICALGPRMLNYAASHIYAVRDAGADLPLHMQFDEAPWLSQVSFSVHGRTVAARPIVMFDDVHRLRPWQRALLYSELLDHRSRASVWFAERTYVINPLELLTGAIPRRTQRQPARMEQAWSNSKPRQYVQFVTSIADRRMAQMRMDLESFGDYLSKQRH